MRFFFCLSVFVSFFYYSFSQQQSGPCKIKGRVIDSLSSEPVDYATVTLFVKGGTTVAGGMITDEKGQFSIDNLAPGEYDAKIDFIGYNTKTLPGISVTEQHSTVNIGDVKISSSSRTLNEVKITGSRKFMENQLDKFVYNVEKDVTSQGGVATDVLKKIPQVSVDVDGNVELLGNSNIRVFVNGKPSSLFDNNLTDALNSIPANQIKNIEVITSPGAQYDAQGTGGIINIVLKDNKAHGINGNISASAGTRLENISGNIHIKEGSVELSASILGNYQIKANTPGSLNRRTDSMELIQNTSGQYQRTGAIPQLGFNWDISKTSSLSAGVTYSYLEAQTNGMYLQDKINDYPLSDTQTQRNATNNSLFRSIDANVNYKKKFKKDGQELNISYQWNEGLGGVNYSQYEDYTANQALALGGQGHDHWRDQETYVTADYAHPIKKNATVNAGIKGTFSRITDNSDHFILNTGTREYEFDSSQVNNFIYNRNIYAAYVSVTFPLFKVYQLKLGIRDEETTTSMPGDTVAYTPSYNFFIPSVVISSKLGDNQNIKLSYTKRIQRPGFRQLNPFVDATDPLNIIRGNPALLPEKVDNVEFSYYRFFDKGSSILVTAYERYQMDDNQSYIEYFSALPVGDSIYRNVAVITTVNASIEEMAGINISGNIALSQKFELRGSFNFFEKHIISHFDSTVTDGISYRISGNANYQFSSTLVGEVFYSFNSPRVEIQGTFPAYSNYSFALRKLFYNKKLSIGFTTTDPFNRYVNQVTNIKGNNFTTTIDRKVPNQSFGISASYRFGKMEYKEKKSDKPEYDFNNPSEGS